MTVRKKTTKSALDSCKIFGSAVRPRPLSLHFDFIVTTAFIMSRVILSNTEHSSALD